MIIFFYAKTFFEKTMESMSGGFVRVLSENEDKIDNGQKINVLHDIMQDEAFEAALEFQINNDDEKDDVSKYYKSSLEKKEKYKCPT